LHAYVCSEGIIINFYGPSAGCDHDSTVYYTSEFAFVFAENLLAPEDDNLCVSGDSAYARSPRMEKPWDERRLTPTKRHCNKMLRKGRLSAYPDTDASQVRVSVEHGFGLIIALWPYIDYSKRLKSFLSPICWWVEVAVILTNLNTCMVSLVLIGWKCHLSLLLRRLLQ
jgi:hypothetical protein